MAQIVLGIGTSHSPQLSTPPEQWVEGPDRFKRPGFELYSIPQGKRISFEELDARAMPGIDKEVTIEKFRARYDECQANLAWLAQAIETARPDVLVMFGDDQKELFLDELLPSFSVYWGQEFSVIRGKERLSALPAYSWDQPRTIPAMGDLGRHIIEHLCANDIDVCQSNRIEAGRSISHPFAFVHRRILGDNNIPTVPIWINTYFAPNQPSSKRCYELGRAVRAAIEDWPKDLRVGIVASGGLSHFTIDEELDRTMLKAMKERDTQTIYGLPKKRMQSGTSESNLWIATAGAVEHLEMTETRYVPCYRTRAGTGCAMGFATWN
jgi:hypothetical protein